jgi:hypothetical protein
MQNLNSVIEALFIIYIVFVIPKNIFYLLLHIKSGFLGQILDISDDTK